MEFAQPYFFSFPKKVERSFKPKIIPVKQEVMAFAIITGLSLIDNP